MKDHLVNERQAKLARFQKMSIADIDRFLEKALPARSEKDLLVCLEALAEDERIYIRRRVAESCGRITPSTEEISTLERTIIKLAKDPTPEVRDSAVRSLKIHLRKLPPLDRTRLLSKLSTSSSTRKREAASRALPSRLPILGAFTAIEHLAADGNVTVRKRTLEAVAIRLPLAPSRYLQILKKFAQDPAQNIRLAAVDVILLAAKSGHVIDISEALWQITQSPDLATAEKATHALARVTADTGNNSRKVDAHIPDPPW